MLLPNTGALILLIQKHGDCKCCPPCQKVPLVPCRNDMKMRHLKATDTQLQDRLGPKGHSLEVWGGVPMLEKSRARGHLSRNPDRTNNS